MFKIGDGIIMLHSLDSLEHSKEGTITKRSTEFVWIDNKHKAEDCIYECYCFPIAAKGELTAIIANRAMLKKVYEDSIQLIYGLKNKVARGEFNK